MVCSKCGARIQPGKIYCSVCGTEVQLVPDYNFLEDDMLSDIVSKGIKGTILKGKKIRAADSREDEKEERNIRIKYMLIWAAVLALVIGTIIVLFFAYENMRRRSQENSYDYQYKQAVTAFKEGNLSDALSYYKRAWELNPKDSNAPYEIADIYMELDKPESAEEVIRQVISQNGYDSKSCQKLIDIYDSQKEYNKIRELCEEVKDIDIDLLELFDDYLVERPSFSRISGTYTRDQKIEILSSKGYDIYFTTNGSDPAESGTLYHGELNLKNGTSLVQAVTKSPKGIYSEVVKATYTIRD